MNEKEVSGLERAIEKVSNTADVLASVVRQVDVLTSQSKELQKHIYDLEATQAALVGLLPEGKRGMALTKLIEDEKRRGSFFDL